MPMTAIVLGGWFFNTYPTGGPMSKAERDWWLENIIMRDAFLPPAGPKQEKRVAYRGDAPRQETRSGSLISKLVDD